MERFSQFRDKGSGIAPFLPIPTESAGFALPVHIFLYVCRVPLLIIFALSYFLVLQWLPIGIWGRKAGLWGILGIPGIWWIDLQVDGVKKGSLAKNSTKFPEAGSIITSSRASPIDPCYLAAIFDPIFAATYPHTKLVERISLFTAIYRSFTHPKLEPAYNARLVDLETLVKQNPDRIIVVFPECTTTNGRGILPLSPSLLTIPPRTKIFPFSLRYTAPDVTTPIPHCYFTFMWNLCSKPSHCIRIRVAEAIYNTSKPIPATKAATTTAVSSSYTTNYFDTLGSDNGVSSDADTLVSSGGEDQEASMTREERAFLDKIAEALARLGRVKRVGLGVKEKIDFIAMWATSRSRR
ncbi:Lysophosphatidic acid:oleoyl-CoA acyltransferase 1 [Cladophialophora chaetospira]|uniref:Lysophosphatidic acid:oleoyl-CoA acyltransferase 1 n=1 Tax=Cladophialophora chaetospira TaxID=386627 RepID=A0AA39CQD3_9EURO|nr:Lysophosphatidic acid:oleoyl-CoA acyltransferase 1 [Cladophialophora chaetospira]